MLLLGSLLQRVLAVVLVMLGAATIVFGVLRSSGDPALMFANEDTTPETLSRIRHDMGFDRSLPEQYADYVIKLASGDFGTSLRFRQPVGDLIRSRLPATLWLTSAGILVAVVIGVSSGAVSALTRGGMWDHLATLLSVLGQAVPPFWLGIVLVMIFGVSLRWLPTSGDGDLAHLILPAFSVGAFMSARVSRLTRAALLQVLHEDYLRTARSKGLPERLVLLRHAAPNAAIPVITVVAVSISSLIGGSIIVETVFAWPGVGQLMVQGVLARDYQLVQGTVLVVSALVAMISLLTDVLYTMVDPRIRQR